MELQKRFPNINNLSDSTFYVPAQEDQGIFSHNGSTNKRYERKCDLPRCRFYCVRCKKKRYCTFLEGLVINNITKPVL
jgi:hypothetical protein